MLPAPTDPRRVRRRRTLLTAALLALLAACQSERYRGFAEPVGGHDAPGHDDQLYFHAAHAEGHPARLAALVLPADWPARPAVPGADGSWRLVPPVELVWRHGEDVDPHATITHVTAEGEGRYGLRVAAGVRPLPRWTFDGTRGPAERDAAAVERLALGKDAYRIEALDGSSYPSYRVLGAVLAPDGGVRWIELAVVPFEDGRPWTVGALHGALVTVDTAAKATLLAAAVVGGIWLTGYVITHAD